MAIITQDTPFTSTVIRSDAHHPLCWGAVIAGAVAALSAHLLITLFGIGLGVQLIDPAHDAEPIQKLSLGVGVAWSVGALLSLWIGGWVAGRLTPEPNRRLGRLHGVLVWSLATVIMAFVVTSGTGMLVGGVARLTGKTLAVAGTAGGVALGASGDAVKKIVDQNGDLLGSFAQELAPDSANGANTNATPANQNHPGARREISWALVRFFSLDRNARSMEAHDALVKTVAANSGLGEADAARRVDEWIASYDRVQADLKQMAERAQQKAREAAEITKDYLTHVAVWTFIAFLIGAIAATCGGNCGAKCRRENDAAPIA